MRQLFKTALLLGSLGLFGWYMSQLELNQVRDVIRKIGPWAPLILGPYFVVYLVDCLAWRQTIPGTKLRFMDLLRIRWAGESVNNVIPTVYVGGDAVKVWLLRRQGVDTKVGTTSVVVARTAQTIAQAGFILLAALFLFWMTRGHPGVRYGIVVVLLGALVAVGGLCWIQCIGLFRFVSSLSRVFPVIRGWREKHQDRFLEFDETTFRFYRKERRRFAGSVAVYFLGWLLDTVEIVVVAYLLDVPISWPQALIVEAFAGVAKVAGMWVPGSLGVQESGIVGMSRLADLPDGFGFTYALIRRVRDLIFAGIGWYLLYLAGTNLRAIQASASERVQEKINHDQRSPLCRRTRHAPRESR
jgi:glycosyltransferase 2 family protein